MLPDPLIPIILDMLTEVMGFMATMNTTSAPTYNNVDYYLRGTTVLAYQVIWNSLTDLFSDDGQEHATTRVSIARDVIRASVSAPRMYAWFGLNLLLTVAGLILMWLQSRCYGKAVGPLRLRRFSWARGGYSGEARVGYEVRLRSRSRTSRWVP